MIKLLYFSWVREKIGRSQERFDLPASISTAAALLDWLEKRSDDHAAALSDRACIRVAVNQQFVDPDASICDGDEIAIFPPVTGG